jgi:hypothetical protein
MGVKTTFHRLQAHWTRDDGTPRAKVIGVWREKEPAIAEMTRQLSIERKIVATFRIVATTAEIYRISFGEVIDSPLTKERIISACSEDYTGLCVNCGSEHSGIEPDARGYKCDDCEQLTVYGAEELMIRLS